MRSPEKTQELSSSGLPRGRCEQKRISSSWRHQALLLALAHPFFLGSFPMLRSLSLSFPLAFRQLLFPADAPSVDTNLAVVKAWQSLENHEILNGLIDSNICVTTTEEVFTFHVVRSSRFSPTITFLIMEPSKIIFTESAVLQLLKGVSSRVTTEVLDCLGNLPPKRRIPTQRTRDWQ